MSSIYCFFYCKNNLLSKNMNIVLDKKKMTMIAIVVIIIALIGGVGFYLVPKMNAESNAYSVVYLTTGEIYIGQLSVWPKMELNNAYLLQTVKDATDVTKSNIQLTPLKDALWSPKKLYLNRENVVFYGPIEEGSKAAQAIKGAGK